MTFTKLQSLCAAKGIACERRGKSIELTTPCGGTTAVCDGVRDAYDAYATDPAFCSLPIRLRAAPPREVSESDRRIQQSLDVLGRSSRGQSTLAAWKSFLETSGALGLDGQGRFALQTLMNETASGRRDYLDAI